MGRLLSPWHSLCPLVGLASCYLSWNCFLGSLYPPPCLGTSRLLVLSQCPPGLARNHYQLVHHSFLLFSQVLEDLLVFHCPLSLLNNHPGHQGLGVAHILHQVSRPSSDNSVSRARNPNFGSISASSSKNDSTHTSEF